MENWHHAAEVKLDLWRYWESEEGKRYALGFQESVSRLHRAPIDSASRIIELERINLHRAEPIYVAPEIMEIAECAAETFRPEPFLASDFITQHGFVLLPKTRIIRDARGENVGFRAFSFMPSRVGIRPTGKEVEGVWFSFYSFLDDVVEEASTEASFFASMVLEARRMGTYTFPWLYLHGLPCALGETPEELASFAHIAPGQSEEGGVETTKSWWRFVQSLLRLSMQTLSERTVQTPPRFTKRRLQRAKMEQGGITVVTLRRKKPHHEGESNPVDWQSRWIVSGHWRNQWFPTLQAHRQIWINEYVKGPDDKPLVIRDGRVFNFVK